MEKIKTFMLKNRMYFIAALVLLVITVAYFMYKFRRDIEKTMNYIKNNPEAAAWKTEIERKATANGKTFDQQLYLDAAYRLKQDNKGNPFTFLV